ncbi:MAG TPA: alpha/beta hydrolase [Cyclobacteriaceae bacterium]|nr:alpha/beta hydrolase [Cyclobacteriaceae bacterium]
MNAAFKVRNSKFTLEQLIIVLWLFLNVESADAQNTRPFSGYLNINGTKLYTEIKGVGETVIVLHGGPGLNQSYLHPHFNELSKRFRLVFIDMRGHGKSAVPHPDSLRLQFFADDLEALRRHLRQEKLNIIAHSWGAIPAIKYGTYYPHRIKKLILLHPAPLSSAYQAEAALIQKEKISRRDSIDRANIIQSAAFKNQESEAFKELYMISFRNAFYRPDKISKLNLQLEANHAQAGRALGTALSKDLSDFDFYPALERLNFPVLVIHGMLDNIPMEAIERLVLKLPQAELKTYKYCGHFLFIEQPKNFLENCSAFLRKK